MKIFAIEQVVDQGDEDLNQIKCLVREKFWIGKLGTQTPHGLNIQNILSDKIIPLIILHTPKSYTLAHTIKTKCISIYAFNSKSISGKSQRHSRPIKFANLFPNSVPT